MLRVRMFLLTALLLTICFHISTHAMEKKANIEFDDQDNMKKSSKIFFQSLYDHGCTVNASFVAFIDQSKKNIMTLACQTINEEFNEEAWKEFKTKKEQKYNFDETRQIIFKGDFDEEVKDIITYHYTKLNISFSMYVKDSLENDVDDADVTFVKIKNSQSFRFIMRFNTPYFKEYSKEKKEFIIAHEMIHVYKNHVLESEIFRKFLQKLNPEVTKSALEVACDYLSNIQELEADLLPCTQLRIAKFALVPEHNIFSAKKCGRNMSINIALRYIPRLVELREIEKQERALLASKHVLIWKEILKLSYAARNTK